MCVTNSGGQNCNRRTKMTFFAVQIEKKSELSYLKMKIFQTSKHLREIGIQVDDRKQLVCCRILSAISPDFSVTDRVKHFLSLLRTSDAIL